jgi:hypothetical protein
MKKILLIILTAFCFKSTQAQNLLDKEIANNFPEKIYIQYDKPSYFASETVWFKVYVTHNDTPSIATKAVSVELINDSGKIVSKKIFPVAAGAAIGDFKLESNATEGVYTVRAYTEKHIVLNNVDYYMHHFNVYNPTNNNVASIKKIDTPYINFLPEGGNLIKGVKNMIAFKSANQNGMPMDVEGEIKDSKGEFVAYFKSLHNGMGLFGFFPQLGEKYTAFCTFNKTVTKEVALPEALSGSAILNVTKIDGKSLFTIDASVVNMDVLQPKFLVGIQNDVVQFTISVELNAEKQFQSYLPLTQLQSGVLQLTLLNKTNQPLAERLVFVNNNDYKTPIDFKTNAIGLNARQKNAYAFSIKDSIEGTFAIAVTEEIGEINKPDNIVARLLLTESLKGYIHNPSYYFESNDKLRDFYLDLVMLTHGWRRYSWKEASRYVKKMPELNSADYITFKAKVLTLQSRQPVANRQIQVQLKTRDKDEQILVMNTDAEGIFSLKGLLYEDSLQISVKGKDKRTYDVVVQILSKSLTQQFPSFKVPYVYGKTNEEKLKLTDFGKYNFARAYQNPKEIMLEAIELQTKGKSETEKFKTRYVRNTLGTAQSQLDLLEKPVLNGLSIIEYLKNRLIGVNITGAPGSYSVNYRNRVSGMMAGALQMNIFLDNFQVEANDLVSIRAADVALVTVHNTPINGSGGALAIYTKRDNSGNRINGSPTAFFTYEGFSPTKEFFSPDYSKPDEANKPNDNRVTLYWNPFVITTTEKNNFDFSFYNNDYAKKIKIVIEGMQKDGKLLHFEKVIE